MHDLLKPQCVGGDCRPEWNWRRTDCPIHGCEGEAMGEALERHADRPDAITLSFNVVVTPWMREKLRVEGEQVWLRDHTFPPCKWSEADYIQYALARRMRDRDDGAYAWNDSIRDAAEVALSRRGRALSQLAYVDEHSTAPAEVARAEEMLRSATLGLAEVALEVNAEAQQLVAHRERLLREHPASFESEDGRDGGSA